MCVCFSAKSESELTGSGVFEIYLQQKLLQWCKSLWTWNWSFREFTGLALHDAKGQNNKYRQTFKNIDRFSKIYTQDQALLTCIILLQSRRQHVRSPGIPWSIFSPRANKAPTNRASSLLQHPPPFRPSASYLSHPPLQLKPKSKFKSKRKPNLSAACRPRKENYNHKAPERLWHAGLRLQTSRKDQGRGKGLLQHGCTLRQHE